MGGKNWYSSANHEKTSLDGAVLRTALFFPDGREIEAFLNLNLCVGNMDGTLTFFKP